MPICKLARVLGALPGHRLCAWVSRGLQRKEIKMVCLFIKHLLTLCLSCLYLQEGHWEAAESASLASMDLQEGLRLEWKDLGGAPGHRAGRGCRQQRADVRESVSCS